MGERPMRVLHAVDSLRLGGMERMAVELANILDGDQFSVTVCATREGGPLEEELNEGVKVSVLGRTARWDVSGIDRFRRLVKEQGIDIVHSHGRGTAKLVSLCKVAGAVPSRHVFHDHFWSDDVGTPAMSALRLAARLGIDRYVGVYQPQCEWAVSALGINRERVHLVPNGVDVGRFVEHPTARADRATIVLVMVAGFRSVKDHPTLLRALSRSAHRHQVELLLVGPASPSESQYERRCQTMIADLGLGDQVRVAGPRTDVPALLSSADIGVLCSKSETGPLALLEYMAAGLPYVVTDTGQLTKSVNGSGSGFVVPVGDADALSAALDRLVAMGPKARKAMGDKGRSLVVDQFDQRRSVEALVRIYRSLMREPTRRP